MKTNYSIGFSNICTQKDVQAVKSGDKLEVLLNKYSPDTEIRTVSGYIITHGKYYLGFIFEGQKDPKGFIMCRTLSD